MCPNEIKFETYKLHAELAERVAHLREDLNKLYSGMVIGIVAAAVLVQRIAPSTEMIWIFPALGIAMSTVWVSSLSSITGRLSAKHIVLVKMEECLPFDFLRQENEAFNKGCFLRGCLKTLDVSRI